MANTVITNCITVKFLFQSHYSIKKASAALGFGTENVILLNTDERSAWLYIKRHPKKCECDFLYFSLFQR